MTTFSPPPAGPSQAPVSPAPVRRGFAIRLRNTISLPSALGTALAGVVLFLVAVGLVMVLSASAVESFTDGNGFYGRFAYQGGYAALGVVLMAIVSRMPRRLVQRVAIVVLIVACILQFLAIVTPLGVKIGDNTNWIRIGPITGQPSEGIKLGLVIWLGMALGRQSEGIHDWRVLARLILPVAGPSLALVMLGGDLGTTVVMAGFTLGALYFAGARLKHLLVLLGTGALGSILIAFSSATRRGRISAFFGGTSAVNPDVDWQLNNAHYALASGGLWGVGLGNSHAKWSWLPSADTDFIFAVIGEELGLVGAAVVLVVFSLLAVLMVQLMRTTTDAVARITTGTMLVWLIFQAFVNIAVVLGLIPVLGVPLPFISAGGTALVASLIAIGVVLSYARELPPRGRRSEHIVDAQPNPLALRAPRRR